MIILTSLIKKITFGIAIAFAGLSVNAFTIKNNSATGELVGRKAPDQWLLIELNDQGIYWDCFTGGSACTGNLKANATPDSGGFYSDNEVDFSMSNFHFEELEEVEEPQK